MQVEVTRCTKKKGHDFLTLTFPALITYTKNKGITEKEKLHQTKDQSFKSRPHNKITQYKRHSSHNVEH